MKGVKGHPYQLTDEQREWLVEEFPVTENTRLCKVMGISYPTLYKLAGELHLTKSDDGMKAIMARQAQCHKRLNRQARLSMLGGGKPDECSNIRLKAYTPKQIAIRWRARAMHGYLLDEDSSEGSPGRYTIYYDDETRRSHLFEENSRKLGFRFEMWPQ